MKQSEFKKRYDPELGRFTRQHIYGEGVMDVFKNIGAKVFGQTLAKAAKTAATKAVTTAATKTGEHVGEKAGDKIIKFLSRKKRNHPPKQVTFDESITQAKKTGDTIAKTLMNSTPITREKPMTQQEMNQRLGLILSDD